MIIRKPYAFLIKYFKIIHIIFFVVMAYLAYKLSAVYNFFSLYAKTGTYTYTGNMTFMYINIFMVILAIALFTTLFLIFLLMKQKEKKVLYYILATIFYFISFIIYIYLITIFNKLEYTTYSTQTLVIYRDICMALYYLNYPFLILSFIRGFGFNIKKFNFEKDLKELDIKAEDREEIEVGGKLDYENVGDFLRRRKRNFLYYVRENSFILIIFSVIVSLSLISYILITVLVTNKIYGLKEDINISNFHYIINNGYIIKNDINGNLIKTNKYYAIIDFNIANQNDINYTVDLSRTRILVNNKYYYPKSNVGDKFKEFGKVYKKQVLKVNENNNFILVYEIDSNSNNLMLELLSGEKTVKNETIFKYKKVNIKPYAFSKQNIGEYKLNDEIDLSKSYFNKGKLNIINMELVDDVTYEYKKCYTETKCIDYNKKIEASGNNKVLKVEYTMDIDKNIFNYLKINNQRIKDITPSGYKENEALLDVPIEEIDNLKLVFDVRGTTFSVSYS